MSRLPILGGVCLILILASFAPPAVADDPLCDLTDEEACLDIADCCWYTPLPPLFPSPQCKSCRS